ncbi:MAG: polysaccharide deacetylase family protein [Clostridiales bacterium]|nr:polysaccharide deacetylase family protein [Clostridiales bacterium]MCF8021835.1 polysaccharide deacetylase family protein [Clostridiales bacterium]
MSNFLNLTFAYMIYTAGASFFAHKQSPSIIRRGPDKPAVALTFDDGPDPYFTPHLLNILTDYKAKATFFVVGKSAQKYPDLVQQAYNAGHTIGIHTWKHRHPWLVTPWGVALDLKKCKKTLKAITGDTPRWYRPPWGCFNMGTVFWPGRFGQKTVLWSIAGKDWIHNITSQYIVKRICKNLKPGIIVLLHDHNYARGSTQTMLQALPIILDFCKINGWELVTLDGLFEEEKY